MFVRRAAKPGAAAARTIRTLRAMMREGKGRVAARAGRTLRGKAAVFVGEAQSQACLGCRPLRGASGRGGREQTAHPAPPARGTPKGIFRAPYLGSTAGSIRSSACLVGDAAGFSSPAGSSFFSSRSWWRSFSNASRVQEETR